MINRDLLETGRADEQNVRKGRQKKIDRQKNRSEKEGDTHIPNDAQQPLCFEVPVTAVKKLDGSKCGMCACVGV